MRETHVIAIEKKMKETLSILSSSQFIDDDNPHVFLDCGNWSGKLFRTTFQSAINYYHTITNFIN